MSTPLHPGQHRVPARSIAILVATEVAALGSLMMPIVVGLSLKIQGYDLAMSAESALSLVTACGAVVAMAVSPVFGHLSDRTRERPGGRTPWLLGGAVSGSLAVVVVALAPSLPVLLLGWCLAQLCFNATFAALYGIIADIVPEHDRARVSGWFGGASVLAIIASMIVVVVVPGSRVVIFVPMPILAVVLGLVAARHFRDVEVLPAHRDTARLPWSSLFRAPQFAWVFVHRLLVQLAYVLGTSLGFFFLVRRVEMGVDGAARSVALVTILSSTISLVTAVVVGRATSGRGSYGPVVGCAMTLMAAALVIKAYAPSLLVYAIAAAVLGLGIGGYYAVDLALVMRAVPMASAGRFLGAYNVARTLPQSLAPSIAPALLAIGHGDPVGSGPENYVALFGGAAVLCLVALVPLRWVTVLRRESPRGSEPSVGPAPTLVTCPAEMDA